MNSKQVKTALTFIWVHGAEEDARDPISPDLSKQVAARNLHLARPRAVPPLFVFLVKLLNLHIRLQRHRDSWNTFRWTGTLAKQG